LLSKSVHDLLWSSRVQMLQFLIISLERWNVTFRPQGQLR